MTTSPSAWIWLCAAPAWALAQATAPVEPPATGNPAEHDARAFQPRSITIESFVTPSPDRASVAEEDQVAALWRCRIRAQIIEKVRIPPAAAPNAFVAYVVLLDANGRIEDMQLWKKSGDHRWDSEVARAIRAAEPIRMPADTGTLERVRKISVVFSPQRMNPGWPAVEPRDIVPSPTAPAPGPGPDASQRFVDGLIRAIGSQSNFLDYPAEARRNWWEGTTQVRIDFDPRGAVQKISVAGTSGYAVLDTQALVIVKRAQIPPMPLEMLERSSKVEVPVRFQLLGPAVDCAR